MADFDLSKITGREPPLVTDDERDAEIAYLSDVVANRDRELAALRARVAELEGDLNVARLQLGARVCSECPAKARVAELEAALVDARDKVEWIGCSSEGYDSLMRERDACLGRIDTALRLAGNKSEVPK